MVLTTERLLDALKLRGISIRIGDDGTPLMAPKERVTPAILKTIRWHREAIIKRLRPDSAPSPRPVKDLIFYRMKSGQITYRLEWSDERKDPPYGADATSKSDKGPWVNLSGHWETHQDKAVWIWEQA